MEKMGREVNLICLNRLTFNVNVGVDAILKFLTYIAQVCFYTKFSDSSLFMYHKNSLFSPPFDKLVVDVLVDECAGSGAADLALVEEEAGVGFLDGPGDVHVVQDDVGALTAQFEGGALQPTGAGSLLDLLAHLGGTGEGYFVDLVFWKV